MNFIFGCFKGKIKGFHRFFRDIMRGDVRFYRERGHLVCVFFDLGYINLINITLWKCDIVSRCCVLEPRHLSCRAFEV
jgi:hypothetical protein